jgi:hypothetical protein
MRKGECRPGSSRRKRASRSELASTLHQLQNELITDSVRESHARAGLRKLLRMPDIVKLHAQRFRYRVSIQLLPAGVPVDQLRGSMPGGNKTGTALVI